MQRRSLFQPRKLIFGLLKWGFAIGLIYALSRSEYLSLAAVKQFASNPVALVLVLVLAILANMGTYLRWQELLRAAQIRIPYSVIMRLGLIGSFFSTVVPGSVGGDVMKAVFVARRFPTQRARSVSSVILDRIIGLVGVLILGAVFFLYDFRILEKSGIEESRLVLSLGWFVVAAAVGILLSLSAFTMWGSVFLDALSRLSMPGALSRLNHWLIRLLRDYQSRSWVLWKTIGQSLVWHSLSMLILFIAARELYGAAPWGTLDFGTFVLAAVLGVCAMSIPITPMGVGVGQVAFSFVFFAAGAPTKDFGANLVTILQLTNAFVALLGGLVFLGYRHEVQESLETHETTAEAR